MDVNLFKGNLDLILLSVLEREEGYGLEITKRVEALTEGHITLNAGSLYPALHRLERARYLAATLTTPGRGGPPVKTYRLTEAGRAELHRRREGYAAFDRALRSLW
ncbi:PadR family transcriptional regulator [Deinococcus metallilatus]|uniref:DNA-binding PadR family transcriptional regulator n=1 Tax=Deinococcus metallilatus TaxID=1211322 RepID=A0AAJ5F5J1_9DEIO|nr:PadR family transcriptional regulator [Deinococcus metallilatus]MBB5294793.1 DNA-binding PadR family transcriptional regulator [Deinococcus metallilatus]QBY09485.1 PadR family transcriptional regulator [Deinococcus metallilatus]RXJ09490.1 PadR family transcriptional regulator [Deinococcus metallilatus]TLK29012.1 helix-turn-helix transcriptional regulator [Deinococcus metallilatus]GMA16719.1 PadR family transcriptional regulator [Deinococcus metallilatus]